MSGGCFLGIDTSNYTTSAGVYDGARALENRKLPLPVAPGARGLRQSDAVFHHTRQLPELLVPLGELYRFSAIGVSATPRAAEGSYMPCFLVGRGYGEVLGAALGVPVYRFSHQQGHIAAALYSAGRLDLLERPFLAFHVSGGTTEALMVTPEGGAGPAAELAAQSLDLKAGQAVDRVGVALGLSFPCGPELEQLALAWPEPVRVRPAMKGADCSLSGVENQCMDMIRRGCPPEQVARHCMEAVAAALEAMCARLLDELGPLPVVFSGGVAGNSILRERLEARFGACFAEPAFSADNGVGAAVLAWGSFAARR